MMAATLDRVDRRAIPPLVTVIEREGREVAGRGKWVDATCPRCGRNKLRVNTESNRGVCMLFGCEFKGDAIAYVCELYSWGFPDGVKHLGGWIEDGDTAKERGTEAPARPVARVQAESGPQPLPYYARKLWDDSHDLAGGIAEAYLHSRQCVIPPADGDLRFHPAVRHHSGYVGPALIALGTDAVTREPRCVHRTWITEAGKAHVSPAKMVLGPKMGCVLRLWPDECVTHGLGVAEGIETALSLAHGYAPVWATLDAGNLSDLPVLGGIEFLLIAQDNDPAGRAAAESCAQRWAAAGVDVRVTQQHANDLNDVAQEPA